MARIKGKDLYLKDEDQIYFGDNKEAAMWYSGSDLMLDHTISGTQAIQGYHLVRKDQICAPFGCEFQHISSEGESSTTSTSWQQKLRLTTSSLLAGTYRIGWYFESYSDSGGGSGFRGRVQIDDITTIMEITAFTKQYYFAEGGFEITSLSSGSYNIDIDYCSLGSGKDASIRRARLEFWRVS